MEDYSKFTTEFSAYRPVLSCETDSGAVSSISRRKLDLISLSFGFNRIRAFVLDCVSLFLAQTLIPARFTSTNALAKERLGFNSWTADFKSGNSGAANLTKAYKLVFTRLVVVKVSLRLA